MPDSNNIPIGAHQARFGETFDDRVILIWPIRFVKNMSKPSGLSQDSGHRRQELGQDVLQVEMTAGKRLYVDGAACLRLPGSQLVRERPLVPRTAENADRAIQRSLVAIVIGLNHFEIGAH